MSNTISNSDDVIDSRDVIARIEELEETINDIKEAHQLDLEDWKNNEGKNEEDKPEMPDISEEEEELKILQDLQDEANRSPDWPYGESLIRDSYFVDYVEELVKDIGDIPRNIPHYIEIDWDKTADNIKQDYMSVDFDGIEYWIRS